MSARIAIVTGAGGAIGAAIASRLAEVGNLVVAADLDLDGAAATQSSITSSGGRADAWRLDVADPDSRANLVAGVLDRHGRIDVLVNCAGILRDARIGDVTDQTLLPTLTVNLLGPLALARQVIEPMTATGGGSIINIASRAWLGIFGSASYSMTKGALVGATRSLALELGPAGIRVNAIAPGYVHTPMSASLPEKVVRRSVDATPLRRAGDPDDVARLATELAHPHSFVTGQVIAVCGGRTIGQPEMAEGTAS
ncbi:SDR family NAD(P)-dependent oxidoreductase [Nocardioides sp. MAHUQ-72]|uniref:SDR family NAD(P)-dependent oxidoreductase n=1 Tax=unclassified Nocardioides TaxID=2615069 RepID=UPI00360D8D2E